MKTALIGSLAGLAFCVFAVSSTEATGGAVETFRDMQTSSHPPVRSAFDFFGKDAAVLVARGDAAKKSKHYQEAVSWFTSALQYSLNKKATAAILARRAEVNLILDHVDKALEDANTAISLDPGLYNPYVNRGLIYRLRGDLDRAMRDYDTAIRLNPKAHIAFNNRGVIYSKRHRDERAIEDFNASIRIEPGYANAYLNRGASYFLLRQYARAMADFSEAIRRDPNVENAHYNRGTLYLHLGEYDRAIADLDVAIRRTRDPNAIAARAEALRKKKQQPQQNLPKTR